MYLHGFDYVLSNGGMTLALQDQSRNLRITEVEKWNISVKQLDTMHSLSIQHYSGGQILIGIFQKLTSGTL